VFVKDRVIRRCNRRFAELLGHAPADLLGRSTRLYYGSDDEFAFGATSYPFLARGESHVREQQVVRRDGSHFWCRLTGRAVNPVHPEQESVWLFEDVTEQRAARELLELRVQQRTAELAEANAQLHHDELTGLPNRRLLLDRLAQLLALARRTGEHVAVMFIELDRFKTINDSLGHAVGDELLRAVAQRLCGAMRETDTLARLGGDEFVLVLPRVELDSHVAMVAQKLIDTLAAPFCIEGHELHVTPSIGIALYPEDGDAPQTLLRNADAAMHHAKEAGSDNYQFFALQMNVSAALRLELENDLRHAIERDELFLEYQPRVDLTDGSLRGVEALVRWRHPRQGVVGPSEFIPLAEEIGIVARIGEWVLERSCRQLLEWQRAGVEPFPIAVNLSPHQFRQRRIAERIGAILADTGVPSQLIELEITETRLMAHTDQTMATLDTLHRMGLRMSIDAFGTGYPSLGYLKRFPLAHLKIDRSFVRDLDADPATAAIVSAIAMLGGKLGLSVVAQGVETVAQLDAARRCGCTQAQGHLLSRPLPAGDVLAMLGRNWLADLS
jgi:diguanylate cyclase (GGDEF)-like protein/PAS domain S-box-containing protein